MKEEWRDIVGYEGLYQVSNLGRVRSLDRVVKRLGKPKRLKGKTLSFGVNRYYFVCLSIAGAHKNKYVHTLVAEAFIGPRPKDKEILHGEKGRFVNSVDNLRYGTHSENAFDMLRDGTSNNRPIRRNDGRIFTSAQEAERQTGINRGNICAVCNKYIKPNGYLTRTAGGYSWEFI